MTAKHVSSFIDRKYTWYCDGIALRRERAAILGTVAEENLKNGQQVTAESSSLKKLQIVVADTIDIVVLQQAQAAEGQGSTGEQWRCSGDMKA